MDFKNHLKFTVICIKLFKFQKRIYVKNIPLQLVIIRKNISTKKVHFTFITDNLYVSKQVQALVCFKYTINKISVFQMFSVVSQQLILY